MTVPAVARQERNHSASSADLSAAKEICLRSIEIMNRGSLADFEEVCHPAFFNHEAKDEPAACRNSYGPAAIYATSLWLRHAFSDLRWEVHSVIAEGELVVVHCTNSGRHVNAFVTYDENARVRQAFPPTGKRYATTQTHWFRVADGKVIEHWANRDDMNTALQLNWVPPSPLYLLRMAFARWRARRAINSAPATK